MSEEQYKKYKNLLDELEKIPYEKKEQTYLGLCHYSGERFEEICSRILEFYFQPKNEHGFKDLWLKALCDIIKLEIPIHEVFSLRTTREECTYVDENRKRIDLILETQTLAIVIENKIIANLYNDIRAYKNHIIESRKNKKTKFVVLTARELDNEEKKKATDNDFVVVTYEDLFNHLEPMIGGYATRCNQKYLTFMLDFIQTIKDRVNMCTGINDLDNDFFNEHREEVEGLIRRYNEWCDFIWVLQREKIDELHSRLVDKNPERKWENYQDGPYIVKHFEKIGIEGRFDWDKNNPIGVFKIWFTNWDDINNWERYEKDIKAIAEDKCPEETPKLYLEKGQKRAFYYMPPINVHQSKTGDDSDKTMNCKSNEGSNNLDFNEIIEKLNEYYDALEVVVNKNK